MNKIEFIHIKMETASDLVSSKSGPIPVLLLSKPLMVGYMSVDAAREYRSDLSELKYITSIPRGRISFDLNHNIDHAVKRTSVDNVEKIDLLLKFLLDQNDRLEPDIHFISYRRTFIHIICSAFYLDPTIVLASLFQGSIYLCTLNTPEEVYRKQNLNDQNKKFVAWGYKFEQFMTADSPNLQPDIQKPVVENAEFSLYYCASLGNHKLLYGAQIDGMLATSGEVPAPPRDADYETNLQYLKSNDYVELKTNREIQYRRQEENFKKNKMLKCWCQCYLAGLKGLIVGYRTDHGIIQSLQWLNTEDIPKYCEGFWDPATGLEYLDFFLTFVKTTFKNHITQTLGDKCSFKKIGPVNLRFDIDKNRQIRVSETSEHVLPDWFIDGKKRQWVFK